MKISRVLASQISSRQISGTRSGRTVLAGLAAAAFGASALFTGGTAAMAAEGSAEAASPEQVATLKSVLDAADVPQAKQDLLIARVGAGKSIQSMTPGARALEQRTEQVGLVSRTFDVFADGSVSIADVQSEPGTFTEPGNINDTGTPASESAVGLMGTTITNCGTQSGSGYVNRTNCLVRGNNGGSVQIWFYASWSNAQGKWNDKITKTENPGQTCTALYSCSIPSRSAWVPNESSSSRAGATYTSHVSSFLGSQTAYLSLSVGNDTWSVTFTMP